ncbi:GDSL-type esterase/lipase family protein [Clostridium botulinum]|uniref:SGNH hydrolase-type esterase domain-containing protein n=1 Tax=Clostridium botulinum TaxID=1491 RepID=A0A6B4JJ86_CLOBO|nr:SGNH/GDSL hydrolase family protein [Clostridium botulinum]EES49213.1 hypothetical protein CLO_1374 [Clostridium botulinum E1 str. 'BoNT E Beluga']MBY6760522.1 hypothetical protein [Clostridium botulinum]MBY6919429.1 hypothetical protein [Clostridium botulinum]MCR1130307.1 GDSL-type esterase/lipase family protein [Clostridium botulinum]NFJ56931.1 hypothetical protein [Clostridium botulinum]
MTTYSPFELEPIFIDFKNESYNLGLDIQANQNDTLTLNFICRNNGIEEDMSKYKVELRVHNNNTNTDYIQTQNENVTLGTDGSVKIVCQSLKGNKLTAYSGQCNGVLRIFNTENKQKATRIITMRIIADPLETDRANICESTITKLEDLDWILNEAYNIEDEFKKAIEEAIKQKNELIKTTNEAKVINSTLAGNITTGTELNSNLVKSNKLAETNQKELDTRNTTASQNIETLTNKNTTANETIVNISEKIETGSKLDNDLGLKIPIGTTLKNDLNTNIKTGTQLKTDLIELIPKVEKSKSDLDTSKINADSSNTTLLETTNNAETKKQEVVVECKVADEKIKQMNEFGDVTEVVKDVTLLKEEVKTARDNETDLNARLERDKTNILKKFNELDNQDIFKITKDIKNKNIKILGDSIGAGVGGTGYSATGEIIVGNNKSNETGHCWANSFRDYLQSKYNCIVKNWSVSGWKSSDIVTNISTLITETDDIVICAIGANNCYIENGTTLLESDIKTINEYCENHNKKVIFIGTIQTLTSSHENKGIKMEDIDNLLRKVTTNLNVCFIPMYKLFNDYLLYSGVDSSLFYYNEEHPNDNGYDAMFYLMANYMGFYTDLELRNKLYSLYDTGWLPLPLINGTVANTIDIPSYRRVGRMLSLKGEIDNIISTVTTVATLPSGFTPNSKFGGSSIALSFFWTGADTQSRMFINKNGNIIVPNHTDTKKMWLDGINFMID